MTPAKYLESKSGFEFHDRRYADDFLAVYVLLSDYSEEDDEYVVVYRNVAYGDDSGFGLHDLHEPRNSFQCTISTMALQRMEKK